MLMVRRVTQHRAKTVDNEFLQVITIWEPGVNKEQVKKMLPFTKRHHVLVYDELKKTYTFKK